MARRRANNEGTVYRRKDGRYEAAVYLLTISGKRKRIRQYGVTRQEAHDKLVEAKAKAQQGIPVPDKAWKLGEYLEYWLEEVVKRYRSYNTYAQCERTVRLYIKPRLGSQVLTQISAQTVTRFLDEALRAGSSVPKVQVMRKVLSSALTNAMREDLLFRNPARTALLPSHEAAEHEPWSAAEAQRFLTAAQSAPLYAAFLLVLLSGLRRGEVLGLLWRDIDLERRVLHVRRQLQRSDDGLQLTALKTKASKTDLPLLDEVVEALRAHREEQVGVIRAEGGLWAGAVDSDGLVFPAEHGRPMEPSTLRRAFNRMCRENSIRQVRIHDARDGLATLLDEMGVSVKQIQLFLRHSRVTTTLEHYVHGRIDKQRSILRDVGKKLLPTKEEDDTQACHLGAGRSRQISRQTASRDVLSILLNIGAGHGTLTRGLILGNCPQHTIGSRITEVDQALTISRRHWHVGIVAVNCSRQRHPLESSRAYRSPTPATTRVHETRMQPSYRMRQ